MPSHPSQTQAAQRGELSLKGPYYLLAPAALLLAAQRAFISCDSFLRPAGVSPPFLRVALELALCFPAFPLRFAHRALAAAASFARVCKDIR
jgi:hypothetical protein